MFASVHPSGKHFPNALRACICSGGSAGTPLLGVNPSFVSLLALGCGSSWLQTNMMEGVERRKVRRGRVGEGEEREHRAFC